jgi:hypothetical protein
MPFVLEPHVAGVLGPGTRLDPSTHPPIVTKLEYVLDLPDVDDLIESFPVFLVSAVLAARLADGDFTGFALHPAAVTAGADYGDAAVPTYRRLVPEPGAADPDAWVSDDDHLCVSDRLMAILRGFELRNCDITTL